MQVGQEPASEMGRKRRKRQRKKDRRHRDEETEAGATRTGGKRQRYRETIRETEKIAAEI